MLLCLLWQNSLAALIPHHWALLQTAPVQTCYVSVSHIPEQITDGRAVDPLTASTASLIIHPQLQKTITRFYTHATFVFNLSELTTIFGAGTVDFKQMDLLVTYRGMHRSGVSISVTRHYSLGQPISTDESNLVAPDVDAALAPAGPTQLTLLSNCLYPDQLWFDVCE